MAATIRIKCPHCGEVRNVAASGPCPKCGNPIVTEQPGAIMLYRMGNVMGSANGFSIYINEQPYGQIGNRELLRIPLPYGTYKIHIACGMNRKCNDPVFELSPNDPCICTKVHMKMGFISNTFIIERVAPNEMPQ